jgi:hypothetical protein
MGAEDQELSKKIDQGIEIVRKALNKARGLERPIELLVDAVKRVVRRVLKAA